jgi:hypothetical protein
MMQRPLVGAADIHARAAAYRLKAFQNLDVSRRIAFTALRPFRRGCGFSTGRGRLGGGKEIGIVGHVSIRFTRRIIDAIALA